MNQPSGESLRKGGPMGKAPHSGTGTMSQSMAVTANTVAREIPENQSVNNTFEKPLATYKGVGELGARGHGGMS